MARLPVVALMGPTAAGKTACAVALAQRGPFSIVSVDSAMIYRGMDIGTAKPDAETRAQAPHRMIDILDPAQTCTAYGFAQRARAHLAQIHRAGRIPLLVGGSRLYFLALMQGLSEIPDPDPEVRARLRAQWRAAAPGAMHARPAACDPATARMLAPADRQRILRALEVWESCGIALSAWHARRPQAPDYAYCRLALWPADRAALHARIAQRFDRMLEAGLVAETKALRARGDLSPEHASMRCVGYRQVWRHLDGALTHAQMRAAAVAATRQLAKRQLSWLRHAPGVRRIAAEASPEAAARAALRHVPC